MAFFAKLLGLQAEWGRGRAVIRRSSGTAEGECQKEEAPRGSSHSLVGSSARKLRRPEVESAALSSTRAARPLAANILMGKVFLAPTKISFTSPIVPCTE